MQATHAPSTAAPLQPREQHAQRAETSGLLSSSVLSHMRESRPSLQSHEDSAYNSRVQPCFLLHAYSRGDGTCLPVCTRSGLGWLIPGASPKAPSGCVHASFGHYLCTAFSIRLFYRYAEQAFVLGFPGSMCFSSLAKL